MADEELDGVARLLRNVETVQSGGGEPDALLGVLDVLGLADVVQEQRQRQQLRRAELLQQATEALARRSRRVPQPFEAPDGEQRVLVDRVAMIEVPDHAAMNALELGE